MWGNFHYLLLGDVVAFSGSRNNVMKAANLVDTWIFPLVNA